jgi:hypothetical protein
MIREQIRKAEVEKQRKIREARELALERAAEVRKRYIEY